MAEIFAFFMRLIELHVQEFREKTAARDFAAAASNGRVVQVIMLLTNITCLSDIRVCFIMCLDLILEYNAGYYY